MSRHFDIDSEDTPATYAVTDSSLPASPVAHEPGGDHAQGQSASEGSLCPWELRCPR